jgi:predicted transposase/invertase (TIGR01784 family)
MIKNNEVKAGSTSKNIDKAQAKLIEMNMSEEERRRYEKDLINVAREKDMLETAMEEGIKKGEKKGKIEIALVMIEKGYDNQLIHEITGLAFEEIEKLRVK